MAIREIDLGIVRGPQGVKGDRGPQGVQGIQGVQGPKGDPGITPAAASKAEAQAGTENTKYMTSKRVRESLEGLDLTPVGDIVYRPYLKAGYVKANGATVNRADYPSLVKFATDNNLWTSNPANEPWKFGQGDGSKTMALPDYRNRFIQGGDIAGKFEAGLPNVTGTMAQRKTANDPTTGKGAIMATLGCFTYEDNFTSKTKSARLGHIESDNMIDRIHFDASQSSSIYGSSSTVQPPSVVLMAQIKY